VGEPNGASPSSPLSHPRRLPLKGLVSEPKSGIEPLTYVFYERVTSDWPGPGEASYPELHTCSCGQLRPGAIARGRVGDAEPALSRRLHAGIERRLGARLVRVPGQVTASRRDTMPAVGAHRAVAIMGRSYGMLRCQC
jgi:hypothetical protein